MRNSLGEITGVIHGSALNRPRALDNVSVQQALDEVSPKLSGAINLCSALRDAPPKLFIAFSSITAVSGMMQNGWYAFSNEALNLVVQQYGVRFPKTAVLTIAFSIWDEVGMGVKMGSTSWLEKMGVDAISPHQGTARFLRLISHDPGDKQVIVAARTPDLDTFTSFTEPVSDNLQFLENITAYSPGIEITSRTRLTLDRDAYIKDHNWRGTYLFPMVFGLEAMAQAVRAVTGITCFDSVCIENIKLSRPITLTEDAATEIEIHAQTQEQSEKREAPQQVHVQIRSEHTTFNIEHFSAIFILTSDRPLVQQEIPKQRIPLDITPTRDLYNGKLLFQGPLFQRIQQIYHLTSESCLFKTAVSSDSSKILQGPWNLGDPFLRDSFLQSGQIPIPKELCLPKSIERIERFPVKIDKDEVLWGRISIERRTEKAISGTVTLFNDQGQVVEHITGYQAQIVEQKPGRPTAEEMAHPGKRDHRIIQREAQKRSLALHFIAPEISSDFIPNLKQFNKQERRKQEVPLLRNVVSSALNVPETLLEIAWSDAGKPYLTAPSGTGIDISLAHNEGTVICTAGQGHQGNDLETVSVRSPEKWGDLLGQKKSALLNSLIKRGEPLNKAGTRIWS
ncbi:MAG: KR domain-containing protein, partial [Candidatus Electrothrix sp. AR4]|nr:KR domain-containing protein [Candidatus Electrothrix sp. AR4]